MINTWYEAVAVVASVVVACGTALKILAYKKDAAEDTRILAERVKQNEKDIDHLHSCVDNIQDNFIKILTENLHDGDK